MLEKLETMELLLLAALFCVALCVPDIAKIKHEAEAENGQIWALLAAGSRQWRNYRHQADVCHAYHVLHSHGVPDDHIVVMMYDDIAYNKKNPDPGVIINHPNGENVYKGTPKDYTGDLHAKDLNEALVEMHSKKSFRQLVAYVEACRSGSMFDNILTNNISVYAMTAANPYESSWSTYPSSKLHTCLGDVFSVKWMENSDKANMEKETIEDQYKVVKEETRCSHVMQYGNISVANQPLGQFQGMKYSKRIVLKEPVYNVQVKQGDTYMYSLMQMYGQTTNETEKETILNEIGAIIQARHDLKVMVEGLVKKLVHSSKVDDVMYGKYSAPSIEQWQCHKEVMQHYWSSCTEPEEAKGNLNEWTPSAVFINLCLMDLGANTIIESTKSVCETNLPIK